MCLVSLSYSTPILQFNGGGQLYILRKPVIFMVPEGVNISRGPKLFQEVKLLIFIDTYRTCDFPWGRIRLDPRMQYWNEYDQFCGLYLSIF